VLALVPGVALGIWMAILCEPGLGLATFVGTGGDVSLFIDWPALALLVGALVGVVAAAITAGGILEVVSAGVGAAAFLLVAIPYVILLSRGRLHTSVAEARARDRTIAAIPDPPPQAGWKVSLLIAAAVVFIVLGAEGMVRASLSLADDWHISDAIVGILVLAVLTSLPNAFTAIRLGTSDRGTALVSETLNSNTINLAGGVMLPALIIGLGSATALVKFDLAWFIGMTLVALFLLSRPRPGRPFHGMVLIALYVGFVAVHLVHG